jgi:cysteine desulfurase / selenocysteine lyase
MPSITLAEIIAEFEELDDPTDRLAYLVEIGKSLPPLDDALHTEEHRVLGCQSMVWMVADERPGPPPTLAFTADSDAPMVRGLIAILLAAYSNHTPAEILAFPIEQLFERLKLLAFLTPMRSNGLHSMVKRIQNLARRAQAEGPEAGAPGSPLVQVRIQPRAGAEPSSKTRRTEPIRTGPQVAPSTAALDSPLDVEAIRRDFPILATTLAEGYPLAYLDNGASTQRPRQVIAAMVEAYEHYYSNVHRGGHALAAESTVRYEAAREAVREFINARSTTELIFCSGTTAAINLVARSYGDANLRPGDEILLTEMEHHSNIVPWQQAAERTGATIRWVPITEGFELDMAAFDRLLSERTKIVAVTAMSNVLGTINPIAEIIRRAHSAGAVVLVDAAQAVPHEPIDVRTWDADFLAFSGHKMLGPSGVGVLYGREKLLDAMPPFHGGGSMIKSVTLEGFTPADLPYKFEAGTPMIVAAIGLGKAVNYLEAIGLAKIRAHDLALTRLAHERLADVPGLSIIGPVPEKKGGLVSFVVEGVHPDEVSKLLDLQGIAIRAGHHCAMPLHHRLGLSATSRASFYLYNTAAEVERLATALRDARRVFQREGPSERKPKHKSPEPEFS